ncbi:MAG: GGDEF domain-containing protein [Eubacterium sp.]|nr:GGDEF domain-containing protein [Eubacterium sp.]
MKNGTQEKANSRKTAGLTKEKGVNEERIAQGKSRTWEENSVLNKYLLICWTVMNVSYLIAYTIEHIFKEVSLGYFINVVIILFVPYIFCFVSYKKDRGSFSLRYKICLSYMLMYGYALLTGVTNTLYVMILPLISFLVLYHDATLVLRMGLIVLGLNLFTVIRDACAGVIDETNMYSYEVQIMLIIFCFGGALISSHLYNKICEKGERRLQELLKMQKQKTILEERNKYLLIDALTGFGTRRAYEEELKEIAEHMPDHLHFTVVDVNDLKGVNDKYGHAVGDRMIMQAAERVKSVFSDETDKLYRIGGDEFAVVSSALQDEMNLKLDRLRKISDEKEGTGEIRVSFAVGSASKEAGMTIEGLFELADRRMYADKEEHYKKIQYDRRKSRRNE